MEIFKKTTHTVNNTTFGTFEFDSLTYRAEPIKERQRLVIPGLQQQKTVEIDLQGILNYPLLVTGISIDIESDDNTILGDSNNVGAFDIVFTNLIVQSINRSSGKVEFKSVFQLTNFPSFNNELIINPQSIYRIKPDRDVNSIIFVGVPVNILPDIVFLDSKLVG